MRPSRYRSWAFGDSQMVRDLGDSCIAHSDQSSDHNKAGILTALHTRPVLPPVDCRVFTQRGRPFRRRKALLETPGTLGGRIRAMRVRVNRQFVHQCLTDR